MARVMGTYGKDAGAASVPCKHCRTRAVQLALVQRPRTGVASTWHTTPEMSAIIGLFCPGRRLDYGATLPRLALAKLGSRIVLVLASCRPRLPVASESMSRDMTSDTLHRSAGVRAPLPWRHSSTKQCGAAGAPSPSAEDMSEASERSRAAETSSPSGEAPADATTTCAVPSSADGEPAIPVTPALRQRKGAAPAARVASTPPSGPLPPTPEESVPAALARAAPAGPVTFEAAIIAGAFQTQAVRLAMAAIAAALAVHGHLAAAGVPPLLQLLATNAAITLSAAWLLMQQPERCRGVAYQMSLRSGGMLAGAVGMLEGVLGRRLVTTLKAIGALGWGAYVDSGCYLTIVIALYLHLRGDVSAQRPLAADSGADVDAVDS